MTRRGAVRGLAGTAYLALLAGAPVAQGGWRDARGWTRPSYAGEERSLASEDGDFRVHWTEEGPNAARIGDADGDGVPDVITDVLGALESAREGFRARGYRDPVRDQGQGGDEALDVYLRGLDANGWAYPLLGQANDGGTGCFLELDNTLSPVIARSVAVHELHHCVQYRYTTLAAGWIYEATATWEQYLQAPESLDVGLQLLYAARLAEPERGLASRGDRYEYAGLLVLKQLEELRRPAARAPELWRALGDEPDWEVAFDTVTDEAFGLSVEEWFGEYAVWNAFACGRDDGSHYGADVLGCTSPSSVPVLAVDVGERFDVSLSDGAYTATYAEIAGSGVPLAITCGASGPASRIGVALIATDPDGLVTEHVRSGVGSEGRTLRLAEPVLDGGSAVVVISSTALAAPSLQCEVTEVPAEVARGCDVVNGGPGRWIAVWPLLTLFGRRRGRPGTPDRT